MRHGFCRVIEEELIAVGTIDHLETVAPICHGYISPNEGLPQDHTPQAKLHPFGLTRDGWGEQGLIGTISIVT